MSEASTRLPDTLSRPQIHGEPHPRQQPRLTETKWTTATPTGHGIETLETQSPEKPWERDHARQPAYIAFTHRVPYVVDAYQIGFAPGVSEEYDYQDGAYENVNVPVVFLDNNFRDPDIDRWLHAFSTYEPTIGVLGDAFTRAEAREYVAVANQIKSDHPAAEPVIVPKCDCFDLIPDDIILGYAEGAKNGDGKAATHPHDFSDDTDWRGRRVHILGGTPPRQYKTIHRLTAPGLQALPPADIIGLDYNGYPHMAQLTGKYWTRDGWQNPREERGTRFCRTHWASEGYIQPDPTREEHDYSLREKVKISLHEAKRFFIKKGLWPEQSPRAVLGPAVLEPDAPTLVDDTPITYTRPELESGVARIPAALPGDPGHDTYRTSLADEDHAHSGTLQGTDGIRRPIHVVEYEDGTAIAYRTPTQQSRHETDDGHHPTHGQVLRTYSTQATRTARSP